MFSQQLHDYVDKIWQTAPSCVPSLEGLTEEEALLCRLAYGTLPSSDAAVPLEVMLGYVRHALFLRRERAKDIPEELFLHFVFYPRINSEDISDCRAFFYEKLAGRIQGLSQTEAILEINRWCAQQVTYQASNERTESPLTAYFSGIGRCGEESTFTVTALRSVGIPARQIYVPFWSHCDDNHAWVEVFCEGKWNFLGACEPEPILNRGWFTDASSRAPLVCYRRFFDFTGDALAEDACVDEDGFCTLFNVTARYAPVSRLTISVFSTDGTPVAGARVVLSVVNMAAFSTVARLVTDENGMCFIDTGRGTLHAEVWTEEGCACENITVSGDCQLVLTIKPEPPIGEPLLFDCDAPAAVPLNRTVLTQMQQREKEETLSRCASIRRQRIDGYFLPEYGSLPQRWQQLLRLAAGNAPELWRLYQQASPQERELYLAMLEAMEEKDYRDTPASLLENHLRFALPYRDQPHFITEILCPRIQHEMLECWREPIAAFFTEKQKKDFTARPESLMAYLNTHFPDGALRYYSVLSVQPTTALKLGHTDEKGRRLLFVAVMRTLGVPSRIDPSDGSAEYYRDGVYHCVSSITSAARAQLELLPEEGKRFVYGSQYALSRRSPNGYQPLQAIGGDSLTLSLMPGDYRLLTTTRMPNGKQQCILSRFRLAEGEKRSVPLCLREPAPEEMLGRGTVEPFTLRDESGQPVPSAELLRGKTVLIFLDVGREPTEHILNEIIAAGAEVRKRMASGLKLAYVLHSPGEKTDPTLQKALSAVPEAELYYDSFTSDATMLARKLFLEPGVWPLLMLSDETHRGCYGTCGYQVGTLELTLKLADCIG